MDAGVLYGANFWKTGDDWTVFDSSNITADVTFEALHEKVKVKITVSPTEPD